MSDVQLEENDETKCTNNQNYKKKWFTKNEKRDVFLTWLVKNVFDGKVLDKSLKVMKEGLYHKRMIVYGGLF